MEITQEKIERLNNRANRFSIEVILNEDNTITFKKDNVEVITDDFDNMREVRMKFRELR